ncbi:Uncharacterised protein [Slackia heliotrinireducens]|uniref:Uncharacterized protein n=1 Tax=Slackia heliotrinireducens (strain ATCC 29202 / DSM 20476 / NCTC 11029 / RHS 1) TaxID=471855 RepID=C7N6R9_SLAHD|nr:helix-turn-helix domain-containing protein [Slackia heliotrinireducens]ACV22604.1 hypothetical protein Shel_15850 [Slackia heliotrinireducens DSM 20476]VEH01119.1 Uncharacterised protein [Slackia heliotrinireducens]
MGTRQEAAAVERYIRVQAAWLRSPVWQSLSKRQADVFLAMMMFARIDKATPKGHVRTSLAAVGKEVGMTRQQVHDNIKALVRKGALVVVDGGGHGRRAEYRIASPVSIELEAVNAQGADSRGEDVNPQALTGGGDVNPQALTGVGADGPGPLTAGGAPVSTQGVDNVPTPNKGGVRQATPPLVGDVQKGGGDAPRCPCCGAPLLPVSKVVDSPKDPTKLACKACRRTFPSPMTGWVSFGGQDRALGKDRW